MCQRYGPGYGPGMPDPQRLMAAVVIAERDSTVRHLRRRADDLVATSKEPQAPWPRMGQLGGKGKAASMEAAAAFVHLLADEIEQRDHHPQG